MASSSESEIVSLFINAQTSLPLRVAVTELGHPQPPTPIQTENSMAPSFADSTVKQERSKTIDMRYYWLQDRQSQKQIRVFGQPNILTWQITSLRDILRHTTSRLDLFSFLRSLTRPFICPSQTFQNNQRNLFQKLFPQLFQTKGQQVSQHSFHHAERV